MSNTQENGRVSLVDTAFENGTKKGAETFVNRALNGVIDFAIAKYGEAQVVLGTAFQRYLENATHRYNQIRTLATGTEPRSIIGKNNIYVSVGVKHQGTVISTTTVEPMLKISSNLLIQGTGGAGKSMLMRYLFLTTAYGGNYIPVLLELRRISSQEAGKVSIIELIYSCMKEYDIALPSEQFEYSLRSGKYLFLFDGFDEVKEALSTETADAIQKFSAKYPKNPCIITSRPSQHTSPLETFTTVKSMPLDKSQAVLLASKIWTEDEKTREFCNQLNESLFDKHRDFAENPLLLTMMFLTFMRNNSIPDHLVDFYQKAYDALYSTHDNQDKGYYQRDFSCNTLDESRFKCLFARFCFQTFFKEIYEFSKQEILDYIQASIEKLGYSDVNATSFLSDLRNIVCMIVKDGDVYRFSHRSFQTYFAACYTSQNLTDEQQKSLFNSILSDRNIVIGNRDYYKLLSQIEPDRFAINALEERLKLIIENANSQENPEVYVLRLQTDAVGIHSVDDNETFFSRVPMDKERHFSYNVLHIFMLYIQKAMRIPNFTDKIDIIKEFSDVATISHNEIEFDLEKINASEKLTQQQKQIFYSTVCELMRIPQLLAGIADWLVEQDRKRALLTKPNFIDSL